MQLPLVSTTKDSCLLLSYILEVQVSDGLFEDLELVVDGDSLEAHIVQDVLLYGQMVEKHVLLGTVAEQVLDNTKALIDVLVLNHDRSLSRQDLSSQHLEGS